MTTSEDIKFSIYTTAYNKAYYESHNAAKVIYDADCTATNDITNVKYDTAETKYNTACAAFNAAKDEYDASKAAIKTAHDAAIVVIRNTFDDSEDNSLEDANDAGDKSLKI